MSQTTNEPVAFTLPDAADAAIANHVFTLPKGGANPLPSQRPLVEASLRSLPERTTSIPFLKGA